MQTQKQIHCIASISYGTTGTHKNLYYLIRHYR